MTYVKESVMTFMPFLAFHFHFTLVSSYFSLSLIPFQMKFKGSVHSHFKLQERNTLTKTQTVRSIWSGWTTILHTTRMEKHLKSCKSEQAQEQDAEELSAICDNSRPTCSQPGVWDCLELRLAPRRGSENAGNDVPPCLRS